MPLAEVQEKLLALGYNPGPADGKVGKRTSDALKKFQADNNPPVTGRADGETIARLRSKKADVKAPPPR